jgi:hypothetical protein
MDRLGRPALYRVCNGKGKRSENLFDSGMRADLDQRTNLRQSISLRFTTTLSKFSVTQSPIQKQETHHEKQYPGLGRTRSLTALVGI